MLNIEQLLFFFVSHLSIVLLFASVYWIVDTFVLDKKGLKSDKKELNWFDCLYFSLVTQTTVGYGDIVPNHTITKIINMFQLLSVYGLITYNLFV
jgi:hypothetical protein